MGFRMIRPKRLKKKKSGSSQEILRRIEEYLKNGCDEPVEILCGFWGDQQNTITYQELRQMILAGVVSQEMLQSWMQDYSVLVTKKLQSMWEDAIVSGSASQPILDGLSITFNMQTPGILNWIRVRGAEFVTSSALEQKDAIAVLLTKKMKEQHTVDELSRMIRPCIGLTEGQVKANVKYYEHIVESLKKEHPRMKIESIQSKAAGAAQKYAERQHRQRAMTIAQTESAFAYNWGAYECIRQAQEAGFLGAMRKKWSSSGDESVCALCESLDGVEIGMDAEFRIKGRILFEGQHRLPPAHPRCACAVEYIEDEDIPKIPDSAPTPETGAGEQAIRIGEIDAGKTKDAVSYYNTAIRNKEVENAVVIDRKGGVYYAEGKAAGIAVQGIDFAGAALTHNHPHSNGIVSFGKDDFDFLKANPSLDMMFAVNQQYTYSVKVLSDISGISYGEYYRKALGEFLSAGMPEEDVQHIVFDILDREGFIRYAREKLF